MQFADIIRSLRRHWKVSVAIFMLTVAGSGVFLFTRNETRTPNRWQQTVKVLVPVRDADGQPPPGVPANLLYGQGQLALDPSTTGDALRRAGLTNEDRSEVTFAYQQPAPTDEGGRGDIAELTVTTPDAMAPTTLADAFAEAFVAARAATVSDGNQDENINARTGLTALTTRLAAVKNQLQAIDPSALGLVQGTPDFDAEQPPKVLALPEATSVEAGLLVYEGRSLIDQMNILRVSYGEKSASSIVPKNYSTVVERPYPTQITPAFSSPVMPAVAALLVGLLLAVAVPVLIDRLDHSIRTARSASNALSAPVLSTIPATTESELATLAAPGTARESAYRALAATSVATDQLPRAIVVTSPVGEMQDTVAANFAAALAGLGLRVALVATNDRQGWYVDTNGAATLPDLLALASAGRLNGQVRDNLVRTSLDNLSILAPGPTGEDALLEGLPTLLQALADAEIDVTVIAGPALLEDPSATIFAWSTRSVLWVVEAGEVTEQEAREAASRLALAGATPFGVALVDSED